MFFFVEPKNYIRFLEKSVMKILLKLKLIFPYALLKKVNF